MTFGELFAGIGGFSLGLERAGMTCKWQVEIDPYASAVLKKHWPEVSKWDDVRTFPPQGDWGVDLICGGFPCQDISVAGKGAGLAGARSGLWHEFARIIRTVRPRWVVIENVPALTARGLGTVLGDLAEIGMDAEWHCIPACAVGAPHRRDRIWIVANSSGTRARLEEHRSSGQGRQSSIACQSAVLRQADRTACTERADAGRGNVPDAVSQRDAVRGHGSPCEEGVAGRDGDAGRSQRDSGTGCAEGSRQSASLAADADSDGASHWRPDDRVGRKLSPFAGAFAGRGRLASEGGSQWEFEPDVGRVAHGVSSRLDRLRCLGNAVVPQIVEIIGRAIIAHEEALRSAGGTGMSRDATRRRRRKGRAAF